MKRGVIFYVTGDSPPSEGMDALEIAHKLGLKAEKATLVSRSSGYENVVDAWWMLLTKGMNHVVCCAVSTTDGKSFTLKGQPMRLCG